MIANNATVGDINKIADDLRWKAWIGGSLPEGAGCAETAFYTSLVNIYLQYKYGVKSYDEAESEARCARSAFIKAELNEQMFVKSAELWRRIEAPAERFQREKTLEAAEAFYRAVYNV